MRTVWKAGAAVIAVVVVLALLLPLVRSFADLLGAGADSTDALVRSIVEWTLAAVLIAVIYTCLVEGPRAFVRIRSRKSS